MQKQNNVDYIKHKNVNSDEFISLVENISVIYLFQCHLIRYLNLK